ncbi:hypothetical protein CPB83DRAFT_862973 [Crepidotus variabilis]|uniref:Arrestin-like N-terminal domain-containing protein n=1 Tax=Crepidotus variabilis TaxID=179855 RepID=A0A9P6JK13_9AGAR|nr:hypothetical protein CPB83DRAFT_862973 [Crepidotus variabilis]
MAAHLPSYCDSSTPLPKYCFYASVDEQSLQGTSSDGFSLPCSSSLFVKKSGKATVSLSGQCERASIPTYGRGGLISGSISLESPGSVLEVVAIVEGKIQSSFADVGSGSVQLFKEQYPLYDHSTTTSEFPGSVSFDFVLPSSFRHGDEDVALPPSYNGHFIDAPTVSANVVYRLEFVIARSGMLRTKKHVVQPFRYYPRRRAPLPILSRPSPFSSIKATPEEWYQAVTQVKTRADVQIDPDAVHCHLFVPASRIYAMSDVIPFYVQLGGFLCVLQDILLACENGCTPVNFDSGSEANYNSQPIVRSLLQVHIIRRLTVSVRGNKCSRNKILATAVISPTPPDASECCSDMRNCLRGYVNYEGELRLPSQEAGSFKVANVQVEDFIQLTLLPQKDRRSPLLGLNLMVPVRLVTDSAHAHEVAA